MPADQVVTARFHGGPMKGRPTFVVVHDAETPLADSYVASIADYFRRGPEAGTSAHHMVGPRTWIQLLPEDVVAYAAGAKANPRGIHWEQTGYARFTREQWMSLDGLAQLRRLGGGIRESCDRWAIPKRWCTDQQLRDAAAGIPNGGITTHAQIARVLGGTTHTDPEPNYPRDLLLAAVNGEDDGMASYGQQVWDFLNKGGDRLGHLWKQGVAILETAQDVRRILVGGRQTSGPYAKSGDRLGDMWIKLEQQDVKLADLDAKLDQALVALDVRA